MKNKQKILIAIVIITLLVILASSITFIINKLPKRSNVKDDNYIMVNDVLQEITVDSEDDINMQDEERCFRNNKNS